MKRLKFTPPPRPLARLAILAVALLALAAPAQAQWPAADLSRPSDCTLNNPTYALTELYRTGYGDGIGEPGQGYGITPAGSGHLVREGANFSILYRMKACVNLATPPSARVTLDPDGSAKGWNLNATFTGTRPANSPQYWDSTGTVSRWGRWISDDYTVTGGIVSIYVLDIWVHGTTTDDNCIGIPTGSSATASVEIYLLNGTGAKTTANAVYTIRKQEDNDRLRGARYGVFPCT